MVMSVIPMRWLISACWLARGRLSMSVSLVAVCAGLSAALNKTAENTVSRRSLGMGKLLWAAEARQSIAKKLELKETNWSHRHCGAVGLRRVAAREVSRRGRIVIAPERQIG